MAHHRCRGEEVPVAASADPERATLRVEAALTFILTGIQVLVNRRRSADPAARPNRSGAWSPGAASMRTPGWLAPYPCVS
jgi:hypothetical protein